MLNKETRLKRFVITGGPGAGKSTLIETFRQEFADTIQCVPEIPTLLITQLGLTPDTREGQYVFTKEFGHTLYHVQVLLEKLSENVARRTGKTALLLDKSRLDTLVHFLCNGGSTEDYEKTFNTTLLDEYNAYDLVLFLGIPREDVYENIRNNNAARGVSYRDAKKTAEVYYSVWQNHPHFVFIPNESDWTKVVESADRIIRQVLGNSNPKY